MSISYNSCIKCIIILITVFIFGTNPVFSQNSAKTSQTEILDSLTTNHPVSLNVVEVSSDRPVTAASSKFIRNIDFKNRPRNSAQEMLRMVPGLFIAQHAGGGKAEQIFIRGFDCDHGTDVATYVDGIPVNMPSHGHGQGYADLHFLIPETVKDMEIFKGPYSYRYGDFATGAAVEFKTLDSLENNLVQSETVFTPHTKSITATRQLLLLNLPVKEKNIKSYLAAEFVNNRSYFESNQHFNRINLFSKTTFDITDHSQFNVTASVFNSTWDASGQIPERAVESGIITRYGSIDNSEGGKTSRNNLNLLYHHQSGLTEFSAQAYASKYNFDLFSNFTFFLEDSILGDQIEQEDDRVILGFKSHYTFGHKIGFMNNMFTIGISHRTDKIENALWHTFLHERINAKAQARINENSTAIFANEVIRFSDRFRMEIGGRFDYFTFDVSDLLPDDSIHSNYSGTNYQTLISPKANLIFTANEHTQFFLNFGRGFHSNDARSVVQQQNEHRLPLAPGAEAGALIHPTSKITASIAFWWMDMENELVYVGDDGTTENKGASRRIGTDISLRYQITDWLSADVDVNISKSRFKPKTQNEEITKADFIPLSPSFTSTGGLTAKFKNGIESSLRYRYISDRPANEDNTIIAHGYTVVDFSLLYKLKNFRLGTSIENLMNTEWNEAQFNTESRLKNEVTPVEEIHFTPGTPFALKLMVGYTF